MRTAEGAGDGFVWLAVGRVSPAKDYPNLLQAFARVSRVHREVELWIAGGMAARLSLAGATRPDAAAGSLPVRWLGHVEDVAAWMDAADGFVLASAWEGMPLALAEAMAMGKPVVATDVGGVRELAGGDGRLVAAGDSEALAEAMEAVMAMPPEERARLGGRLRRRIEEHFSMEPWVDRWEALYEDVLRARQAGGAH
jgi:glycosyltransferase involved in cell wall biosynthesis